MKHKNHFFAYSMSRNYPALKRRLHRLNRPAESKLLLKATSPVSIEKTGSTRKKIRSCKMET